MPSRVNFIDIALRPETFNSETLELFLGSLNSSKFTYQKDRLLCFFIILCETTSVFGRLFSAHAILHLTITFKCFGCNLVHIFTFYCTEIFCLKWFCKDICYKQNFSGKTNAIKKLNFFICLQEFVDLFCTNQTVHAILQLVTQMKTEKWCITIIMRWQFLFKNHN